MKIVVLGATKGIGRAVARRLAGGGNSLFLLGRDEEELTRSASDLEQRGAKSKVGSFVCDLEDPASFEPALAAAAEAMSGVDTVVVTAAHFATQARLEDDFELTRRLLTVNFAHTVLFCEVARKRLLASGGGTLCVLSSVAGERGRKPVILYGSSKAGLSAYLEGLDHKFHDQGLRVVCIKPGFVKTSMTEGLPVPPFAGDPDQVAEDIVRAIEKGTPVKYTPFMWGLVMLVIRQLPRFVMRKIGF